MRGMFDPKIYIRVISTYLDVLYLFKNIEKVLLIFYRYRYDIHSRKSGFVNANNLHFLSHFILFIAYEHVAQFIAIARYV